MKIITNILKNPKKIIKNNIKSTYKFLTTKKPSSHLTKQKAIFYLTKNSKYTSFIETGTYMGDMIEAQKNNFTKIISIELDNDLFIKAKNKFKNYKNITILQGDSGDVLKKICPLLSTKSIFWLDGHYSRGVTARGEKETPIIKEIESIFAHNHQHIILVDDARCFNGFGDYPTITELKKIINKKSSSYAFKIKSDMIFILPKYLDIKLPNIKNI